MTDQSWMCDVGDGETARIDLYESDDQLRDAQELLLEFYESTGDGRRLAELPIVCLELITVGVDFNETRDDLIGVLQAAGHSASSC